MSHIRILMAALAGLVVLASSGCQISAGDICTVQTRGGNGVWLYVKNYTDPDQKCWSSNYIDNGELAKISWNVKTEGLISLSINGEDQPLTGSSTQRGQFLVSPPETTQYTLVANYINNITRTVVHTLLVDQLMVTEQIPDSRLAACQIQVYDREYVNQYLNHSTPPGALVCRPRFEDDVKISEVQSLEGIEVFTSYVNLDLSGNDISDLSELSLLPMLRVLDIANNKAVTTLSGLANATNLESLTITNATSLTDVSALTGLVQSANGNLQFVNADGIEDESVCADLQALEDLHGVGVISTDCPAP